MEINIESLQTREDWLKFFAKLGLEAQKSLSSAVFEHKKEVWTEISPHFFSEAYPPVPLVSRRDYDRWLNNLTEWAKRLKIHAPCDWGRPQSASLADGLLASGTSPARRFRFYRRVWRTLGLDPSVWNVPEALPRRNTEEHYRRLTAGEIRRLVATARTRNADLADMILIGYWTGLRLSDVAELDRGEVLLSQRALRIVPNKVKDRKPCPLLIPLVGDAETIVRNRARRMTRGPLFPANCRAHLSRRIGRLFKAARIGKVGNGRASFHSLRATFISLMDEASVQPYITDAITGHASGNMHARYTQPTLAVLRRAVAKAIPRVSDKVSVYLDSESKTRLTSPNANGPFAGSVRRNKRKNNKMKKLMFAAATCVLAGVASAGDLDGVNVYNYKASVKHAYLKEKRVDKNTTLYVKYTKSSSLAGYLVQDTLGVLSHTNLEFMVTNGAPVRAITGADPQPGNRCFLVVKNKSAEKQFRIPRIIPGVLEAKWYDSKLVTNPGSRSVPAQGYLYLGGEVVGRNPAGAEADTPQYYAGFRGTKFISSMDEISYYDNYPEADEGAGWSGRGRMFFDQQRFPMCGNENTWTNVLPWQAATDTRTCNFGIDDYFFTSCYLFGQFNQPTWYSTTGIQEFADCWMNGAGFGKAAFVKGAKPVACCGRSAGGKADQFTLTSLSGNMKAGIYLCTENGDDDAHSMDVDRTGLFEDQFWKDINGNSYWSSKAASYDGNQYNDYYAWYRREVMLRDGIVGHNWIVKQDIWADGNLDLRTTDVGYGTWSIKYCGDSFAKLVTKKLGTAAAAIDEMSADVQDWGFSGITTRESYSTGPLMLAIKAAAYDLYGKEFALFGNPVEGDALMNYSFYWNYLAEGYNGEVFDPSPFYTAD